MNWDQIEGNWKQCNGKAQSQWGKLTHDELDQIEGNRQQLVGKVQERYGIAKVEAREAGEGVGSEPVDSAARRSRAIPLSTNLPR
jgi:uncharacterized protein YjbJ (UPF0337 family)